MVLETFLASLAVTVFGMSESKLFFTSGSGNPCVSLLSPSQGLGAGSLLGGVCVCLGHWPGWDGQMPGTAPKL